MHLIFTELLKGKRSVCCTRCEREILLLGVWGYI